MVLHTPGRFKTFRIKYSWRPVTKYSSYRSVVIGGKIMDHVAFLLGASMTSMTHGG